MYDRQFLKQKRDPFYSSLRQKEKRQGKTARERAGRCWWSFARREGLIMMY